MKKGITIIIAVALVVAAGLGALSAVNYLNSRSEFVADGFVLDPSDAEIVIDNANPQYYFAEGDTYRSKYGQNIEFTDTAGKDVVIDPEHFIHYADGSLGSFTKGVLMDVSSLSADNFAYYSLSKNTILAKNGNAYEMSSKGESMNLTEYVWKISDTDYLLVSPTVTLNLGNDVEISFPDYAQISYVDNGVVRISHETGIYQTISSESTLSTEGGAELALVGKGLYNAGEMIADLNDLTLDDSSYIQLDENVEEDAITIPTFNVINGKDGVSGVDGADGEEGEDGDEGEMGDTGVEGGMGAAGDDGSIGTDGAEGLEGLTGLDGEEGIEGYDGYKGEVGDDGTDGSQGNKGNSGAEGAAGLDGADAASGNDGKDGVEGDSGVTGWDGASGSDGTDAVTAADNTGMVATELKARPTVNVSALSTDGSGDSNYEVTAGSATMTLDLKDDGSMIQGTTKVYLYNKQTGELVSSEEQAAEWGAALENGTATLSFSGLNPGTEYQLVVNGTYQVSDDSEAMDGTYFTKIFKTAEVGIGLSVISVSENSIEIGSVLNGESPVDSYLVEFYTLSISGNTRTETQLAVYSNITGKESTFVLSDTQPTVAEGRKSDFKVQSNSDYYVRLATVVSNGVPLNLGDTSIKVSTLKAKPYDQDVFNSTGTKTYVPSMTPSVSVKQSARSVTIDLPTLADPDNGIKGYRYELFRSMDISSAAAAVESGSSSTLNLAPTYSVETDSNTSQTFYIPDDDPYSYQARVTVLFNDNVKDVEYSSLISTDTISFSNNSTVTAEFIGLTSTNEKISGQLHIKDPGERVLQYVKGTLPIKIMISGEYVDVNSLTISSLPIVTDHEVYIDFTFDSLRQEKAYTLQAYGPWDVDGANGIGADEKSVYLCGGRCSTEKTESLSLVGSMVEGFGNKAFACVVGLTSASTDPESVDKVRYEVGTIENLTFQLWLETTTSGSVQLGYNKSFKDYLDDPVTEHQDSTLAGLYVERSDTNVVSAVSDLADPTHKIGNFLNVAASKLSYEGVAGAQAYQYVLTPSDFGLDDNDSRLYGGGILYIKVISANDYTAKIYNDAGNTFVFADNEDIFAFSLARKHAQVKDQTKDKDGNVTDAPVNHQVTVEKIVNAAAATGFEDADVSGDTVVGLRLSANYPYSDVKDFIYKIYEVSDSVPDEDIANLTVFTNSDTTNGNLTLKLTGTYSTNTGIAPGAVELYFDNTRTNGGNFEWTDAFGKVVTKKDGSAGDAVSRNVLSRGKRYLIQFVVNANDDIQGCPSYVANNHIYPNCAYQPEEVVPLYTSGVFSLYKQQPVMQRYPVYSDATSITYNYYAVDPDEALVVNSGNVVFSTVSDNAVEAATTYEVSRSSMTSDWTNVTLYGLTDGKEYYTTYTYKLTTKDAEQVASSKKLVFKAMTSVDPATGANLYIKGLATDVTPAENSAVYTEGGKNFYKGFYNDGGYQYRLTLQGKDLIKLSAIGVKITGKDASNNPVELVFDPMTVSPVQEGDSYYAFCTIPASELNSLAPGSSASVEVYGYYSSGVTGFGVFQAGNLTSQTSYRTGRQYAIRVQSLGDDGYKNNYVGYINGAGYSDIQYGAMKSFFIAGHAGDTDGITINAATSSAVLHLRYLNSYLSACLADDTQIQTITNTLSIDETGMYSSDIGAYLMPEILTPTTNIAFKHSGDNSFVVQNTMPAVQKKTGTAKNYGANSVYMPMDIIGATAGTKIYAKLYEIIDGAAHLLTGMTLEHIDTVTDGGTVSTYYYDASSVTEGLETAYAKGSFGANGFEVKDYNDVTGNWTIELRIRGLKANTRYAVEFFGYDTSDNLCDLYSMDGKQARYKYEFNTLAKVTINVYDVNYTYARYAEKNANFQFDIAGDDGSGIDLFYKVVDVETVSGYTVTFDPATENASDGVVVYNPGTRIPPIVLNDSYSYYSGDRSDNASPTIPMTPGSGALTLGHHYALIVYAKDRTEYHSDAGYTIKYFIAPVELAKPTFYVSSKVSRVKEGESTYGSLAATIISTDKNKSIVDNKYTVSVLDKDGNVVNYTDITRQNTGISEKASVSSFADHLNLTEDYSLEIKYHYDQYNKGDGGTEVKVIYPISMNTAASATTGASGNRSEMTLYFGSLSNFAAVKSIVITAYNKNGEIAHSETLEYTDNGGKDFSKVLTNWHVEGGEQYTIQIQYRDASNVAIGTDSVLVVIE